MKLKRKCDIFFSKLAEKQDINESEATTFIRTKLSFALVRATHLYAVREAGKDTQKN